MHGWVLLALARAALVQVEEGASRAALVPALAPAARLGVRPAVRADLRRVVALEPWTDAGTDVELARVPGSSAALTALLSKLQDNHRTWEAAFDALDADDSGELDQGEIAQALLPFIPEDGAADLAEGYAKAIIFAMDTDRNGTVDSGEFQAWLEASQASVGAEAAGVVECMSDDECLAEAIVTNAFTSWSANGAAFQDAGPKADPEAAGGAEAKPEQRVRTPGPRTAGAPPPADLSDEAMLSIVLQEMSDADVNELVWKYLGYRYDIGRGRWDASEVFPKWAARYPTPPDLIGVTRTYSREVDEPVLRAVQALQRSVPTEHKDNLRAFLAPLGWTGYKMQAPAHAKATTGLTPNMTRRAQVAQWLYYYREALHGVPVAELRKRRDARAAAEAAAEAAGEAPRPTGTTKQGVL